MTHPNLRLLAAGIGLVAALAVVDAWLWVSLADPPRVPVLEGGAVFIDEGALNQQAGVTLWFFVLGVGFGLVLGLVLGWFGQRIGWLVVAAVLVASGLAALASRYLGIHVFGPDQASAVAAAQPGDLIQLSAQIDVWVAHLGWPIGGVIGCLAAIAGWRKGDEISDLPTSEPQFQIPFADREP